MPLGNVKSRNSYVLIDEFVHIVRYGVVSIYGSVMMQYESDCRDVTGPLGLRCCTMALSIGSRLMAEYDVDPVKHLPSLACAVEIDFSVSDSPVWFHFKLENISVYNLKALEDPGCSLITHSAVLVRYQNGR